MKTCYLDANVLVYFKDESSSLHETSVQLIEYLINSTYSLYTSPLALDEALYSFVYLFNKRAQIERAFAGILALPNLTIINPPTSTRAQLRVLKHMRTYGLKPRDAYHLLTMAEHKISHFATFDNDFKRVFKKSIVQSVGL